MVIAACWLGCVISIGVSTRLQPAESRAIVFEGPEDYRKRIDDFSAHRE
jgi:hypothetical protein